MSSTVRGGRKATIGWNHGGGDWRRLGGFFPKAAPVAPVVRSLHGRAWFWDLFVTGNDGAVYMSSTWLGERKWTGEADNWRPLGGFFPAGAPLAAVAVTAENLDLFVIGNDGGAYTSWWQESGVDRSRQQLVAHGAAHFRRARRPPAFPSHRPTSTSSPSTGKARPTPTGGRAANSTWAGNRWPGRHVPPERRSPASPSRRPTSTSSLPAMTAWSIRVGGRRAIPSTMGWQAIGGFFPPDARPSRRSPSHRATSTSSSPAMTAWSIRAGGK